MGCGQGKREPQNSGSGKEVGTLSGKYIDYEALLHILDEGSIKLLRGSWLMDQRNICRLRRQQDLPKEAFWNAVELRSQLAVVSIVAISYCWLHPVNPDPCGASLRLLQRAIGLRLSHEGPGRIRDLAMFLDFASLPQNGEQGDESDPCRGSSRTAEEQVAYKNGLKNEHVFYASQLVESWMITWTPDSVEFGYSQRGWQVFQQALSSLIKPATMLIELHGDVFKANSWIEVHNGRSARKAPFDPSRFEEVVLNKYFVNGTDQVFVGMKYKDTFSDAVGSTTALWFSDLLWTDEDAFSLSRLFPFAARLERLLLSDNKFTEMGAQEIIRTSAQCPSLEFLDLSDNAISEDDFPVLLKLWQSCGKDPTGLQLTSGKRRASRLQKVDM